MEIKPIKLDEIEGKKKIIKEEENRKEVEEKNKIRERIIESLASERFQEALEIAYKNRMLDIVPKKYKTENLLERARNVCIGPERTQGDD